MSFIFPEKANDSLIEGSWGEFKGARFKIAYATNVRFLRAKSRIEQPFRRQIEKGTFDPKEQQNCLIKALAEAILLDWDGVKDSNKQEVLYTREKAEQALRFDESLREFVMEYSMSLDNFQSETEEHEGNS